MGFHYRVFNNKRPYFITISVIEKIPLFDDMELRNCIIASLEFCRKVKGLKLHGWCLMPSTLYLMVKAEAGKELGWIIRDFKNYTNKRIIEKIKDVRTPEHEEFLKKFKKAASKNRKKIEYKVWDDGYYPDELFTPDYVIKKLNYMHIEPVKHKIVAKPNDYLYSSAKNYMGLEGMLKIDKIIDVCSFLAGENAP